MTNSTTNQIAERINYFNFYYEMQDATNVWRKGQKDEKEIKAALSQLKTEELIEVKSQITAKDEYVNMYFGEHFENLPEPITEATTSESETTGTHTQDTEIQPSEAKRSYRSEIFRNAWSMLKKGLFTTFGRALKAAWKRFKLTTNLHHGIAYFSFRKANGELREAIGTLAANNFNYEVKHAQKPKPELVKFWDIQKRAWRACRIDRLVSVQ